MEKRYFSDILGVSEEADTAKTRYGGEKMTEQKLKELLADMTLEEKVQQTLYQAPAIERLGIKAYKWTSQPWDRWRIKALRRKM